MTGCSSDAGGGMGGMVDVAFTALLSRVVVVAAVAVEAAFSALDGGTVLVDATAALEIDRALYSSFFFFGAFTSFLMSHVVMIGLLLLLVIGSDDV